MEKFLEGKVAIVTGSGQGIGRAVALELASHGATVITNNRKKGSTSDQFLQGTPEEWAKKTDEEKKDIEAKMANLNGDAETTANTIIQRGGKAFPFFGDISKWDVAEEMVKTAAEKFGSVDIVANVAGSFGFGSITEIDEATYDRVTNVKPKGYFNVIHFAAPYMIEKKWGRIINCTSRAFWGDVILHPEYCVANAGVVGLTMAVAMELYKYGITCNAFSPFAQTRASVDLDSYSAMNGDKLTVGETFLPKYEWSPTPDTLAPFLAYLCTEEAKDYSGCIFSLAGNNIGMYSNPIIAKSVTKYSPEKWTVDEIKMMAPRSLFADYKPPV